MKKKSKVEQEITEKFYQLTVQQRDAAWKELETKNKLLARCAEAMEIAQSYADSTGERTLSSVRRLDKLIDEIKNEI